MINSRKKHLILFALSLFFISLFFTKTEAFTVGGVDPVLMVHRAADMLVAKTFNLIYFLITQKQGVLKSITDYEVYQSSGVSVVAEVEEETFSNPALDITPVAHPSDFKINSITPTSSSIPTLPVTISKTQNIDNDFTPDPPHSSGYSNSSDILKFTNDERLAVSLHPLSANSVLNAVASARVDDLFDNQYFDHVSPDGKSASELANAKGYEYRLVGENLALGTFDGEQGIVDAWMKSPGHKANILNGKFTELGVSVKRRVYNGQDSTIAVQIFGLPLAHCPKPNSNTKSLIDSTSVKIKEMQVEASTMLESLNKETNHSSYSQKVQAYNAFAKKVNDITFALKETVESYNIEVASYNSCIKSQ
jgi:uncharacterized protein YkwD